MEIVTMAKTDQERTPPPMDSAMRGIAREQLVHGARLALLEKQAQQDRQVIRALLELMAMTASEEKDRRAFKALKAILAP